MICMRKICLLPLILVVMKWNVTNCIAFCLMTIVAVHLFHLRAPAAHLSMPQLFTHCLPTRPSSVLCWLILCMYYCKTIVWYTFSLLYVSLLFRYCLCKCFFLYHVCPACSVLILLCFCLLFLFFRYAVVDLTFTLLWYCVHFTSHTSQQSFTWVTLMKRNCKGNDCLVLFNNSWLCAYICVPTVVEWHHCHSIRVDRVCFLSHRIC